MLPCARSSTSSHKTEPNVKVYVRIRPGSSQYSTATKNYNNTRECLTSHENTIWVDVKPYPKQFTFDWVAGPETSQESVFAKVGKPIAESCLAGYNGSVFAYGQTGSGKTFTIQGGGDNNLRGLMPRMLEYVFAIIAKNNRSGNPVEYLCKCSYLEIYNEQITDLLNPEATRLQIREDQIKGVFVENLTEQVVTDADTALRYLALGSQNRHIGTTAVNEQSSRSHSVFTLFIQSSENTDGLKRTKTSRLHLIDLAGSERQKSTHSSGAQLKEASHINNTLTTLGRVIRRLVDSHSGKSNHVSYRESKLTFLLRDSLGGNSKTSIIATICPLSVYSGETLSTLKFAQRAKLIKNKAIINEEAPVGTILELQQEIKRMRAQLDAVMNNNIDNSEISDNNINRIGENSPGEIENLLQQSLKTVSELEQGKQKLVAKVEKLLMLSEQQENFLQAKKMIIKLQESKIQRLQNESSAMEEDDGDSFNPAVKELQEQIKILHYSLEHHPTILKFAIENDELRELVERYQHLFDEDMKGFNEELFLMRKFFADLSARHSKLIKEKQRLVQILSKTENFTKEKSDGVEFNVFNQQEKIELLYMELDKLRSELMDEKRNMTELKSLVAKEKAHTNELEKALSSAHQEYQEELDTLQKSYQDSINNLHMSISSSKGKSQLSDLVTTLQNQIHTLSKENEDLRLKLSDQREMLRKTRATLSATEGENRRLSESFSVGEDLLELNKSLTLQFETFTENQNRLKLEKEELIHQIAIQKNQYENELVSLENQLSSEKKINIQLSESTHSLKEESEILQVEKDAQIHQVQQLEKNLEIFRNKIKENEHIIMQQTKELERLFTENNHTRELMTISGNETNRKLNELYLEKEAISAGFEQEKFKVISLQKEVEGQSHSISSLKAQLQKELEDHSRLKQNLLQSKYESEEKSKQIEELSYQILAHQETLTHQASQILSLETLQSRYDALKLELENCKQQSNDQILSLKEKFQEHLNLALSRQSQEKEKEILQLEAILHQLEAKQAILLKEQEQEISTLKQDHSAVLNHLKNEFILQKQSSQLEYAELENKWKILQNEKENMVHMIQAYCQSSLGDGMVFNGGFNGMDIGKVLQYKLESAVLKEKQFQIEKDRLLKENLGLVQTLTEQSKNTKCNDNQLSKLQSKIDQLEHQNVHSQKQIQSDQEIIKNLEQEIIKLSGHSNAKQKIQHYAQVKQENINFKMEKEQLVKELYRKDQIIKKLSTEDKKRGTATKIVPEMSLIINRIMELYNLTKPTQEVDISSSESILKCISALSDSIKQLQFMNDLNQKELLLLRKEKYFQEKKRTGTTISEPLMERPQNNFN